MEISRMWNMKVIIVPVIIRAIGIATESLKKVLKAIPGKNSIDSLQKTRILGTPHIIRIGLQCEITKKCLPYKGNGEYQIEMTPVDGSCDHDEG